MLPEGMTQSLKFKRYVASALDALGNPQPATVTTIGTRTGVIQPEAGEVVERLEGHTENVPGRGPYTHVAYISQRLSGVAAKDVVEDAGGIEYVIIFVHDFGGDVPQEFDIRTITDAEPFGDPGD